MQEIYSFLLASIILTLAPGPDILLVLSESISKGSKSGLTLAAGLVCGLPFHTLILVVGWDQIIRLYPNLIIAVKIAGAVYFIYLAFQTFTNLNVEVKRHSLSENKKVKIFKKGILMNLLNPKVSLFFWLFFPVFLFNDHLTHGIQYAILGAIFIIQAALIFSIVALTAANLAASLQTNTRVLYWMNLGQGILLFGIALYLLV